MRGEQGCCWAGAGLSTMVCMDTEKTSSKNNERLRSLVQGAGLSQPAALLLFNRGVKVRPLKESSWKAYFCKPGTARYRSFSDELLEHAEKVFGKLQRAVDS